MNYRAVGNRCAVDLEALHLPISPERSLEILGEQGFERIDVCMNKIAESLIGRAQWKLRSSLQEAPHHVDCSGFTKWLYAQRGILIPRRPIQQYQFCCEYGKEIKLEDVMPGDLLFVNNPYAHRADTDEYGGIGHVCFVSASNEVIAATKSKFGIGVVKIPIGDAQENIADMFIN